MATATAPTTAGQRFRLDDVSWDFYEHLLEELGDRRVRVTYDRGALELRAPTYRHDLTTDPPPDLAIEIDIASSSLDRMGIYAVLRVPEVWRFDGQSLQAWCLRPDGEYEERERSPTIPTLRLDGVVDFLAQAAHLDDVALTRKFRAWVRKHVVPRRKRNTRK